MIAIVNIDETESLTGEQLYSVRINSTELFRFKHKRERRLSECLEEAYKCAIQYESDQDLEMLKEMFYDGDDNGK